MAVQVHRRHNHDHTAAFPKLAALGPLAGRAKVVLDVEPVCLDLTTGQLEPGGCFLIEVEVPALRRLPPGVTIQAFTLTPAHLGFDEYDTATQGLVSHHDWVQDGKRDILSAPFRYVWPSVLHLMARLARMTLRERHRSWDREPFTSDSTTHVSVWRKNP